jgi:hypothetical protein
LTSPEHASTVYGGSGRGPVPINHNLINSSNLPRIRPNRGERAAPPAPLLPAGSGAARMWPGRSALTVSLLLISTPLGFAGCGHATVPCPTPTTELDKSRSEAERLREDTEKVQAEEEAWAARRDAAAEKVETARARLDSLAAEHNR